jgi:hypothetical protein
MQVGDRRLCSYFVVVGLGDNPTRYEEVSDDAVKEKYKQSPITDIMVINRDEGKYTFLCDFPFRKCRFLDIRRRCYRTECLICRATMRQ